ncbi:LOW QUALITY PROTEIN: Glyco_hydro_16 domain-containing protein/XET_C domain-containing protein, partial [Cephalotus follicularis]
LLFIAAIMAATCSPTRAAESTGSFGDNFNIMWSEDHFKTSADGQIWYLSLDKQTVSAILVREEEKVQMSVYYVSKALNDADGRYPEVEKFEYALIIVARKLRPYFQAHTIKVLTDKPLKQVLAKPDTSGRLIKWSVELGEYDVKYFVDSVPIRVFKNNGEANNFFPNEKPMYLFSSIWNADDWATRGGLEKTDWKNAPFVSSYQDFNVDACQWIDPYPACVSTTTEHWWDQYDAWHLSDTQKMDYAWVQRNLVIYDYCKDTERFSTLPECSLSPWD